MEKEEILTRRESAKNPIFFKFILSLVVLRSCSPAGLWSSCVALIAKSTYNPRSRLLSLISSIDVHPCHDAKLPSILSVVFQLSLFIYICCRAILQSAPPPPQTS